ncbi:PepSY domain-containing protein [Seleniivibrio sp.]|uniref:PepSY domain-containing protein n=1 Tax=Seleniivibrio sp. TaxID=2898801 RepID=UPI0025E7E470|nr:PepSY domain-containing protein [Seleniivibrio sp.]MCD8554249.1 PepSY domain-containing protein [Seleniivibrio sp.]
MKRTVIFTFALMLAATMAFAYGGMGRGMMGGNGMGGGCGQCPQFGQNGQPAVKALTKEEAQKKVDAYIAANLKGYKIEKTQEFEGRMHTMYNFFVKDSSGNQFILRVNPWGNVMGPFVSQK